MQPAEILIDQAPGVDWEAVGEAYRAGSESIRKIAKLHGVSDTAVRKRAKAGKWKRATPSVGGQTTLPVAAAPAPSRTEKKKTKVRPPRIRVDGDGDGDGHFVYVIHEAGDDKVCKVGVSGDPRARLLQLQTATYRRLILAAVFRAGDAAEACYVERAVHQSLSALHLSGEWFRVEATKAVAVITECSAAGGVAIKAARLNDRTAW